jgi:hypothetical protein
MASKFKTCPMGHTKYTRGSALPKRRDFPGHVPHPQHENVCSKEPHRSCQKDPMEAKEQRDVWKFQADPA